MVYINMLSLMTSNSYCLVPNLVKIQMAFDSEPSTDMPSPERSIFERVIFFTIFDLIVIMTSDLLTSIHL